MEEKTKICIKCKLDKSLSLFPIDNSRKSGLGYTCKACQLLNKANLKAKDPVLFLAKQRALCLKNRASILMSSKKYYQKNKEKKKEYAFKNKERIRIKRKLNENYRLANDMHYLLAKRLRTRLYAAMINSWVSGSAVRDLGCSIDELKLHLEKQFQPDMCWENYGRNGWHIDHRKPLNSFDLTNREQVLQACHYTNLQPLWEADNIRKSDNYVSI